MAVLRYIGGIVVLIAAAAAAAVAISPIALTLLAVASQVGIWAWMVLLLTALLMTAGIIAWDKLRDRRNKKNRYRGGGSRYGGSNDPVAHELYHVPQAGRDYPSSWRGPDDPGGSFDV